MPIPFGWSFYVLCIPARFSDEYVSFCVIDGHLTAYIVIKTDDSYLGLQSNSMYTGHACGGRWSLALPKQHVVG
jgi:hypothetical protein